MSDKSIESARGFRTLIASDAQYGKSTVKMAKYESMFRALEKIIK